MTDSKDGARTFEEFFAILVGQINKRLDEDAARNIERFAAAKEAITKAEAAAEIRFQSVNEFRQTLVDQNRDFVRSIEYGAQYKALLDKFDLLQTQVTTIDTTVRGRLGSTISGPAFMAATLSVIAVIVLAGIGGAISLGSLQTHVQIDTDAIAGITAGEKLRLLEHAAENVERGNFQTRQQLNEARIGRIEEDERQKIPTLNAIIERITKLETAGAK